MPTSLHNDYFCGMDARTSLISGLILLTTGIILRHYLSDDLWPTALILAGALNKIWFLFLMVRKHHYKPGIEVFLLITGLVLFFTGLWSRSTELACSVNPYLLLVSGIILKTTFVILFIVKTKPQNHV
ncbi:MAG: hypothetical protein U5L09_20435 [Bacteroidales bacterium]|nr:hypothetical protein [Bacteroidales bacterium]